METELFTVVIFLAILLGGSKVVSKRRVYINPAPPTDPPPPPQRFEISEPEPQLFKPKPLMTAAPRPPSLGTPVKQ